MKIIEKKLKAGGIKFVARDGKKEVGRAFLYILKNDLHKEPFGFMEDVFVDETYRSQGIGSELVKKLIKSAKKNKCYKLVATSRSSRPKVHLLYGKLGFKDWGKEFRIDF